MKKLYLAVTPDEFELPLCVCESVEEIAGVYGVSSNTVLSSITHDRSGKSTGRKFIRIEIND